MMQQTGKRCKKEEMQKGTTKRGKPKRGGREKQGEFKERTEEDGRGRKEERFRDAERQERESCPEAWLRLPPVLLLVPWGRLVI